MKGRLPTAAALLTALALLATPTLAMAQSAGDNQYSDPLAAVKKASSKTTATTHTTATAPSATKAPPVALGTSTSSTPSSTSTPGSLPRTGLDVWKIVAIAAVLLLAGFGLRLRTAGVRRR